MAKDLHTYDTLDTLMENCTIWFMYSVNLYIEGAAAKSGNITKLFVSFEGKGGCKIILKPDQTTTRSP